MIKLRTLLLSDKLYIILLFIALLFSYLMMTFYPYKSKYDSNVTNIKGYIHSIKVDGNKLTMRLIAKENIVVNYYFDTVEEKNNFNLKLGDTINLTGEMREPRNATVFNLFNYKNYLYHNNIFYVFNATSIRLEEPNKKLGYKFKQLLIDHIDKLKYSKDYVKALVIGDDDGFKDDVNTSYQVNGVSHLFAISGSHITFLAVIILFILTKLKVEENKRYYIVILFLLFYMFLTDYAGSVLRAVVFFSILSINKMYYFNIRTVNVLHLTAIILLFVKPGILYDVGFQFSYAISLSLIMHQNFINGSNNYLKETLTISWISFLVSIPICINNFFQINILSPLINIFFVPYVSFIMFPLAFIILLLPFLDVILSFFASILEHISIWLANIEVGTIILSKPNLLVIIIYYVLIFFCINNIKNKCYRFPLILALFITIHHNINYFNFNPYVVFIDVGQGDSAFINLPHNQGNILIDTGGKLNLNESWEKRNREYSIGEDTIVPYLKSIGVTKIDYLILSHGDADHMGESIAIVNDFAVEKVILNSGSRVDLEDRLIKVLENKNIVYKECREEESFVIGNYVFDFLNPYNDTNENDNSLVMYTNLNGKRFLFTGDISTKIEARLTSVYPNLKVDILKVGHHGSITSTSEAFLDLLEPKYAVISVGLNNHFNHPSSIVLDRLDSRNINILQTSLNGSIKFVIRANDVTLVTPLS